MSVRDNLDYLLKEKKELEQQITEIENNIPRIDYRAYAQSIYKDVLDLLDYIEEISFDETYSCETKDRFLKDETIRLGWVKDDIAKLQRVDLNGRTTDMLSVIYTFDDTDPYTFKWQDFGDITLWEQIKESLYQNLIDKVVEIKTDKEAKLDFLKKDYEKAVLINDITAKHQADNNNEIVKEDNLDEIDDYIVDLDER